MATKAKAIVDEEKVIMRAKRTIELGDREFVLEEPVLERWRAFKLSYMDIEKRGEEAQEKGDDMGLINVQDDMLDLIYLFNDELEAEKEYIQKNAKPSQILLAVRECCELLNDPFVSMSNLLAKRVPNRATRRQAGGSKGPKKKRQGK